MEGDRYEDADTGPEPASLTARSTVSPISAGLRTTRWPSASIASSLAVAVSESPAITAPAWPIRRPRGAETPAMKHTSGFAMYCDAQRGRLDLLLAADLADHHDHVGVVVVLEGLQHRLEVGAVDRVAADADAASTGPSPSAVIWLTAS